MKKAAVVFAVLLGLVVSTSKSFADTLHLASVSGTVSGGQTVYPYNFNIDGSKTLTSLMCLDYGRNVTLGETWTVTKTGVPMDNSMTAIQYRADAWLYSQLGNYSNSDIQYAVWSIFDPNGVKGNSAYDSQAQSLSALSMQMAQNTALLGSGFFNQFQFYIPTSDSTGWTAGEPQRFIGTAVTPEPTSLLLMGTGFIGVFFLYRRRAFAM